MPRYKITFDVSSLLVKYIPDGFFEITGFATFEIILTTGKTLTSTDIENIKKKLPFVEIEMT